MHRFYSLSLVVSLFGEPGVLRRWGRIGTEGRSRTDWHDSLDEAVAALEAGFYAKLRRGYLLCS